MRHAKNIYDPYIGNKAVNRNCPRESSDIRFTDKDLNLLL